MDVKDYTQQLAKTRNRFNEVSQEQRDNYEKNLEGLDKNHKSREKSQREVYERQKLDLEENSAKNLERYDKNLKKVLKEKTEKYNKEMGIKTKQFNQDRTKQMNDYKHKLSSISNSFDTAVMEKEKLHKALKENMAERYEDGLSERERGFNDALSRTQRASEDTINKYRDEKRRERNDMLSEHLNEKKQLVQDANLSRNKNSSRHQLEMEILRENARQNELTLTNNFQNSSAALRANKNQQNEDQRKVFEGLTKQIHERNAEELRKAHTQSKADKRLLEKNFALDKIESDRKTNKLLSEGAGERVENSKKEIVGRYENRLENLKDTMKEQNNINTLKSEKIATDYADLSKTTEAMHNSDLDKTKTEMRNLRSEVIGGMKERFEKSQEASAKKYKKSELAREGEQVTAKKKLTQSLSRQRVEFGRTINKINVANEEAMNEVQSEVAKEQTKFYEKTKRDVHNSMEDLKLDMSTAHARKEHSLTQQILSKEQENSRIIDRYENKISRLKAKSAKEMEELKIIENERSAANRRAQQLDIAKKQREFEKTLGALRSDYEERLDSSKIHADLHVRKLTERYEGQLTRQKIDSSKELKRNMALMKANYNKLVDKSQLEKETMVNQYESKMNKLREANRMAVEVQAKRAKQA